MFGNDVLPAILYIVDPVTVCTVRRRYTIGKTVNQQKVHNRYTIGRTVNQEKDKNK